jgi:hypothetical protein
LEPSYPNSIPNRYVPPPPEIEIDGNLEFEVEEIKDVRKRRGKEQYLVSWKGYDSSEDSWEPLENVQHCKGLMMEFKKRQPQKAKAMLKSRRIKR